MTIAELSVRRPVTIVMVYILICVIACVFIPRLGIALYPKTEMPVLSVFANYPGVGPEEVDQNVTQLIVERVKGIAGLKNITSTSSTGSARVMMEFGYDQDLEEAKGDIEQALNGITNALPDGCSTPTVRQFDMSSSPIMRLSVRGNLDLHELNNLAESIISPMLQRVKGVAQVDVNGGASRHVVIDVIHNRLEAYGLSLSAISQALSARNIQVSAGNITIDGMDYEIVTSENYSSLDEIKNTVVTTKNGVPIRIDDLANVYEEYDSSRRKVYINGEPGLYMSISNETDSNASTVSKGIHEMIPLVNEALPKGITLEVVSDNTTMIDATMKEVYSSAITGALLAVIVIFIFLRNLKCSFIIGLSLPISILITLMCMSFMNLTVNMMTMAGLILGMGMVVDSSIVILENIYLHREKGEKPAIAAILGSKNMINAIVSSTLTTLCVFIPMLIYKAELEMIGQMFQEMVITVVISLVASLFVAVTLVPALCGSILQINTRVQKPLKNKLLKSVDNFMEKSIQGLENGYAKALDFCLNNKFLILSLVVSMLILSVVKFSSMGLNLAPRSSSDDQVNVTVTMPIGTNKDIVLEKLFEFQDIILKECEGAYKSIILNSGTSNSGSIQINLPELGKQPMTPNQIKEKLQPYLKQWSDTTVSFSSGRGPGGGTAIDVTILSDDDVAASKVSDEIIAILSEKVPELTDITSDIENGSPRYIMSINKEAAFDAGITVSNIANEIVTAISGRTATSFYQDGDEIDVLVTIQDKDLSSTSDITSLSINTANGKMTLDNFITIESGKAPQRIQRENGDRINHVRAKVIPGATTTEIQQIVEKTLSENLVLPDSVKIQYQGEARDIENFGGAFIIVILLAVFLVFAVMAAQFESLVDPFIIFLSIPLLAIGVVFVYSVTNQQLSMYSIVGIVALVGIVVNNGIVLVDYTNQLVDKKTFVRKACLDAGRNRLRPILMSTLTTVAGMVPMAFFPGEGAESMQPVCITIVGGLCSGAFMTLFVTPIMYEIFNKRREKRFDDPMALINQLEEYDKIASKEDMI
ncbi:MAG: efflux RND transporter permease subunit [Spirochaetaceae bacterium]|nr:efflux RND transporter permease subunit [Spirochaetaceae bacterium]